jgi:hypothetical protein
MEDVDYALAQLNTPFLDIVVLCRMPPAETTPTTPTAAHLLRARQLPRC